MLTAMEEGKITNTQKELAGRVHAILMDNLDRHVTIDELAQNLFVSRTQIKTCFQRVYGMPVFSYTRRRRMEAASAMLADTDKSILEIAGRFGYENGSKFASAFKSEMGIAPAFYRRQVRGEKEHIQ